MPKNNVGLYKKFVKEEEASSKLYRKLGFKSLADDEQRHANFFKRLIKKA